MLKRLMAEFYPTFQFCNTALRKGNKKEASLTAPLQQDAALAQLVQLHEWWKIGKDLVLSPN